MTKRRASYLTISAAPHAAGLPVLRAGPPRLALPEEARAPSIASRHTALGHGPPSAPAAPPGNDRLPPRAYDVRASAAALRRQRASPEVPVALPPRRASTQSHARDAAASAEESGVPRSSASPRETKGAKVARPTPLTTPADAVAPAPADAPRAQSVTVSTRHPSLHSADGPVESPSRDGSERFRSTDAPPLPPSAASGRRGAAPSNPDVRIGTIEIRSAPPPLPAPPPAPRAAPARPPQTARLSRGYGRVRLPGAY